MNKLKVIYKKYICQILMGLLLAISIFRIAIPIVHYNHIESTSHVHNTDYCIMCHIINIPLDFNGFCHIEISITYNTIAFILKIFYCEYEGYIHTLHLRGPPQSL